MEFTKSQPHVPGSLPPWAAPLMRFRQAPDGRLLEVDPLFASLTGITKAEGLASPDPFWNLVHETDREGLRKALLQEAAEGSPIQQRHFRVRYPASGRVGWWQEWRQHRPQVHEGCWLDQSVPWRLYRHLQAMEGRELLADMIPGYVHDLNNALTGILSLADLCLLQAGDRVPSDSPLRQLTRNAASMRGLLQGLMRLHEELDPSRAGGMPWHDLGQLCRDAVALARPAIASRITVELESGETTLPVVGDGTRLQRGITQLLLNAARAIHGTGTIRVQTEQVKPPPGTPHSVPHGRVQVSDTGQGWAWGVELDATELACTTRPGWEGIGAGLHFFRQTAQAMGGRLSVQTRPEGGAMVSLWLPLADESAELGPSPESGAADDSHCLGLMDLVGDGARAVRERLEGGPWRLLTCSDAPQRVWASGDDPDMGWVIWAGDLSATSRQHLDALSRYRPRRATFLVVASEALELEGKRAGWADEVAWLGAVDLLERIGRWRREM